MHARKLALATGLTYNVLEWDGPANDLTFVLVHGFSDLAYGWHEVAERLAPRGHVIAPDMRGHGDSDWVGPGGYYYYMDYLADLDDVIAQAARPRVVLVGHSMGGSVCSYYAGLRPERCAGLVLLEGLGPPDMTASMAPIARGRGSTPGAPRGPGARRCHRSTRRCAGCARTTRGWARPRRGGSPRSARGRSRVA